MSIHSALLDWFDANRRDLPWRRSSDPYAIWVSEIMLQQTQVATVIPYFERWMQRFPTVGSLAKATESEVLELWQGLGYYRRARSLLAGARLLAESGVPEDAAGWLKVPGIGRYTAGAIASIALNESVPLVDGNVERVYARLSLDESSGAALNKNAWQWAAEMVSNERPGDWNQALMELGATVCRPAAPRCSGCPIAIQCAAYRDGRQGELPQSAPKPAIKRLTHHVWIPICNGMFGVRQIPEGEWWAGMWEFPRESKLEALENLLPGTFSEHLGSFSHTVTNNRIQVHVSTVDLATPSDCLVWVDQSKLETLALPAPQRKALGMALASGLPGGQATRRESRSAAKSG